MVSRRERDAFAYRTARMVTTGTFASQLFGLRSAVPLLAILTNSWRWRPWL